MTLTNFLTRSDAKRDSDDQPKRGKLSLNKKGIGSEARAGRMANANVDLQLLNEAERGRQLQKQKKRRLQGREDEVFTFVCFSYLPDFFCVSVTKTYYIVFYLLNYPNRQLMRA